MKRKPSPLEIVLGGSLVIGGIILVCVAAFELGRVCGFVVTGALLFFLGNQLVNTWE